MAKVVIVDNFDRGIMDDVLLSLPTGISDEDAKRIADICNQYTSSVSSIYYMVKPDNYKLFKVEDNF